MICVIRLWLEYAMVPVVSDSLTSEYVSASADRVVFVSQKHTPGSALDMIGYEWPLKILYHRCSSVTFIDTSVGYKAIFASLMLTFSSWPALRKTIEYSSYIVHAQSWCWCQPCDTDQYLNQYLQFKGECRNLPIDSSIRFATSLLPPNTRYASLLIGHPSVRRVSVETESISILW